MSAGIRKVPTTCPHCGSSQPEPVGALSTYCRGCGEHYAIGRADTPTPIGPSRTSVFAHSLKRRFLCRAQRERIHCHDCGHNFREVLMPGAPCHCPSCGTRIERGDIEISSSTTREVHTGGRVHVSKTGFLNSVSIQCAELFAEGRIGGRIECSGTVRLAYHGECRAQIFAGRLVIDRGANVRFFYPVHAREAVINGGLAADLAGLHSVHVGRRGRLEGDVECRSMLVDRGGIFSGQVEVDSRKIITSPRDVRSVGEADARTALWQPGLAFG